MGAFNVLHYVPFGAWLTPILFACSLVGWLSLPIKLTAEEQVDLTNYIMSKKINKGLTKNVVHRTIGFKINKQEITNVNI